MAFGTYEPDENNRRCYRPATPPFPRLEAVIDLLDAALDSIRRLDKRLAEWEQPEIVGRLFARLDAVHSSGAEGSTTTFTDLMEYESSLKTAPDIGDAIAVAACAESLEVPVGKDLVFAVRRLHARLFEKSRDPIVAASAGRLKDRTNGTVDDDAPGGYFYYTRPTSTAMALNEWQSFTLLPDHPASDIVRQTLSHWMFEQIHPTQDGNGRIGRLLAPLILQAKGVTRTCCAFFSEAAHEDKQLYVEALKHARITGDMTGWTRLILGFLHRSAEANLNRLDRLEEIRERWLGVTAGIRSDSAVHEMARFALTTPVFTITDAIAEIHKTFPSVNAAAAKLVELGVLSLAEGRRRDRLFQANEILDLFDRFRSRPPRPDGSDQGAWTP